MKKMYSLLISMIITFVFCVSSYAHSPTEAYSWYCVHTKNGERPNADASMSFIDKYECYYISKPSDSDRKRIFLTFDAGYENGNVEKILDVLKEKKAVGAFFILEHLAESEPELVKRMANEGHLVCNHTANHKDMTKISDKETFCAELQRLEKSVWDCCSVETAHFYRPPEGRFNELNLMWADEIGYKTVLWSFAYDDWDNNRQMSPDKALSKILDGAHDGEILLLHPTSDTNAAILGELIDKLREQGFVISSLEDI